MLLTHAIGTEMGKLNRGTSIPIPAVGILACVLNTSENYGFPRLVSRWMLSCTSQPQLAANDDATPRTVARCATRDPLSVKQAGAAGSAA